MTFGSLFTGIGGFDLGLERSGMKCIWQCENDFFASRVLKKHWPEILNYGDITKTDWAKAERPDLICGGFPCQDISVAGHGAGLDGERSGLFYEAAKTIRILRPEYIILENVAALLVRGLDRVLIELAEIGYDAEWYSIQAADVGLPHYRDRIIILAYPTKSRCKTLLTEIEIACKESYRKNRKRFQLCRTRSGGTRWIPNNVVCTVNHGISSHLDGIGCAGNAIVPDIAEIIGRAIMRASQ